MLADPAMPLWITEGVKKADCGALHGLCIVALVGVCGWLHTNNAGGKMALPEWHDIALNNHRRVIIAFDGDIARNEQVQMAARGLADYLATKGARVEYLWLPDTDDKVGLDDYLREPTPSRNCGRWSGRTSPRYGRSPGSHRRQMSPKPEPVQPVSLTEAHTRCSTDGSARTTTPTPWMSCLATAAVEKFDDGSDPVWVLVISGPGAAKTETVQAFVGTGANDRPAQSPSEAALLSATPKRERAKDATGGLLRRIGERGLLVIKDVTSILSMNRDTRARVLSALREVYDGHWIREVGAEGGCTIAGTAASPSSARSPPPGTPPTRSSPRWATGSS